MPDISNIGSPSLASFALEIVSLGCPKILSVLLASVAEWEHMLRRRLT